MASPSIGRAGFGGRVDPLAGQLTVPLKSALAKLTEVLYKGIAKTVSREGIFADNTVVMRAAYEAAVGGIEDDIHDEFRNLYPRLVTHSILGDPSQHIFGSSRAMNLRRAYDAAVMRYRAGFKFKRLPPLRPQRTTRQRMFERYNLPQPGMVALGNKVLNFKTPYPRRGYAVETGLFAASYMPFGHSGHGRMLTRVRLTPMLKHGDGRIRVDVGNVASGMSAREILAAGSLRAAEAQYQLRKAAGDEDAEVTFRVEGSTQMRAGGDKASYFRRYHMRRDLRRAAFPYNDESLAQAALAEAIRRAAAR